MKSNFLFALLGATACLSSDVQAGGAGDTMQPEIGFRTPSKNIYCSYDPNEQNFGCERIKPSYAYVSAGNPISYDDREVRKSIKNIFVLSYGKSWTAPHGQITCLSKITGLTCKNSDGFGFALSKSSVKMFEP